MREHGRAARGASHSKGARIQDERPSFAALRAGPCRALRPVIGARGAVEQ